MAVEFQWEGLKWDGRGYFTYPTEANDPRFSGPQGDGARWRALESALAAAKAGDFSQVVGLFDVYKRALDMRLKYDASRVMGDAGTAPTFAAIRADYQQTSKLNERMDYCNALCAWGKLRVVPDLLDTYDEFREKDDAQVIPVLLSWLLEPEWGPVIDPDSRTPQEYRDLVMGLYRDVAARVGSEDALVYGGDRFGVVRIARLLLDWLGREGPLVVTVVKNLRRKFEASTGVDCTAFFKAGRLQPLQAAVIVEEFLQGPQAGRYRDGVRYFFGHGIPD